jgi:tetratricopeptide (TPR) repeat protein
MLKDAVEQDSEDEEMVKHYAQVKKERLNFELQEYEERAEHMPTDLDVKFDLGMRYWHAKKYDDAIVSLQEAQNNPKRRVEAMLYLGRSFLHQGMKPEAVDTLKRAIESYDLAQTGDRKSQDLHYWYARALQENAQRDEAILIYSRVYQWDAKFLDVRKRLVELRDQAKA